jgi:hypothetical protein
MDKRNADDLNGDDLSVFDLNADEHGEWWTPRPETGGVVCALSASLAGRWHPGPPVGPGLEEWLLLSQSRDRSARSMRFAVLMIGLVALVLAGVVVVALR